MAMSVAQVEQLIGPIIPLTRGNTGGLPPAQPKITLPYTGSGGDADDDGGLPPPGGGGGTGGAPDYAYDEQSGLWYNKVDGQVAPQWLQDQLNQTQNPTKKITPPFTDAQESSDSGARGEIPYLGDDGLWRTPDGSILPQWVQKELNNQGTGDGSSGSTAGFDTGPGYLDLAQKQYDEAVRQFNLQHGLSVDQFGLDKQSTQQGYLQDRAGTGLQTGDLVRGLANDSYERAKDPGNFPAYLAALSGREGAGGSPLTSLLGEGVQIQSPEGANPLADPRFSGLLDELYGYSKPQSLSTVMGIANANQGKLPQSFYDWTKTQNPEMMAEGGTMSIKSPLAGIDMDTGLTKFIAGEAGPETMTVTPDQQPNQMGALTADIQGPSDGILTPAEGTNIATGKGTQAMGLGGRGLLDQLGQGNAPTPGAVDESTLSRLPPSIRKLMEAGVMAKLGSSGLMDWLFELEKYQLPGTSGFNQVVHK